jgi:hypothetical protein
MSENESDSEEIQMQVLDSEHEEWLNDDQARK